MHCLIDKSNSCSVYDGLALAQANYIRVFIHQDLVDLDKKMNSLPADSLVMTEGIFSMSGSIRL